MRGDATICGIVSDAALDCGIGGTTARSWVAMAAAITGSSVGSSAISVIDSAAVVSGVADAIATR